MAPPLDPIASLRAALRGHYDIEREIGQGAFATVYLARDLKHERKVALKVLHADTSSETGELRFIREIRLLARLQHPNILPLHDSGHVEALLYYVMPYVGGETLRDRISRERQLLPETACSIARDSADALAYAHAQGVIHRDIKPENILLSAGHPILADFGIARAINLAGVRQLTRPGLDSPGTPAYMSPEQFLGDQELDGRSDTYSLGCVLYEMLSGKPPFAGKEGFAKRFTEPPPSVLTLRPDLASWMDAVVQKALARDPADRYQTAGEFVTALRPPGGSGAFRKKKVAPPPQDATSAIAGPQPVSAEAPPSITPRPAYWPGWLEPRRWVRGVVAHPQASAALVAGIVIASFALSRNSVARLSSALGGGSIDSTRIAVLPLSGSASLLARNRVGDGIYSALSDWRGLNLTTSQDVADAVGAAGAPTSTRSAANLARKLHARRFIWGQITQGDSLQARLQIYDVAADTPLKSVSVGVAAEKSQLAVAGRELLKVSGRPPAADGGDGLTQSFDAWSAYGKGHVALARWDLSDAENQFRLAAAADVGFAPAQLWLAQVRALRNYDAVDSWKAALDKAIERSSALPYRELGLAQGLSSVARGDYGGACAAFRRVIQRDSLDFVGWYGLGYCGARDNVVLPDARHSGKWVFRSSYRGAASAFARATEIEPRLFSVLPFDTLMHIAPIQASQLRQGVSAGKPRLRFAAYAALIDDTLGYTPYPLADVLSGKLVTAPQSISDALQRNRDFLLKLVLRWTRQFPDSSAAFEALAILQESRGELGVDRAGVPSALSAIQIAERLSRDSARTGLLVVSEIRLRLKQYQFSRAAALSDSLLRMVAALPSVGSKLAGIAALTGRIGLAETLLDPRGFMPGEQDPGQPLPNQALLGAATSLYVNAALGVCSDVLDKLANQINLLTESYAPGGEHQKVKNDLTSRAWSLAFPCRQSYVLQIRSPGDRLVRMQQSLARGDIPAVRAEFDSTAKLRARSRPGDVSADYLFQEAWALAAIGDTAAAIKRLDLSLAALPTLGNGILEQVSQAAALVRAMILRADLAVAAHDSDTARKWSNAAAILWAHADGPLQPTVQHLKSVATQSR
jgi:tRNA A-37 threonylcarbamoyl transferase component Bud32/tetratricopeptide (TPR) repeat protein